MFILLHFAGKKFLQDLQLW